MEWISGGDVLKDMARERGFDPSGKDWWDTPKGMEFLAMREENFEFDRSMDKRLLEICERGGVIITSYTLPWLTEKVVRVWLECSLAVSARRMQRRDGVDSKSAYVITENRYRRNIQLYRRHYGFDFGRDDLVFDVVVNTDDKDIGQVLDAVIQNLDVLL